MTTQNVAYLNSNWLENTSSIPISGNDMSSTVNTNACLTDTYPWNGYSWTYGITKIRLTLSDVEHMRKCAAKDKKLKAALRKIAPHVEVEIDFP